MLYMLSMSVAFVFGSEHFALPVIILNLHCQPVVMDISTLYILHNTPFYSNKYSFKNQLYLKKSQYHELYDYESADSMVCIVVEALLDVVLPHQYFQ